MANKTLYGARRRRPSRTSPSPANPSPVAVIHWLGRVKGAAARVNGDLGLLDAELAAKIADAADAVAAASTTASSPSTSSRRARGPRRT
jgi:fumarate hydratase class II